jgi:hypothetical protein
MRSGKSASGNTMAGDDKKATTKSAAKSEAPAEKKPAEKAEKKSASDAAPAKADGGAGETAGAAPSGYSRGEGQKPVTKAYKENWNLIFGKKKKR